MARKPPPKPRHAARGAVQRKTALQLRTEGHTFEEIGRRLGVSRQAAHEAVGRELALLLAAVLIVRYVIEGPRGRAPSVLVVVIDTLRADRAWGPASQMPFFAQLARQNEQTGCCWVGV